MRWRPGAGRVSQRSDRDKGKLRETHAHPGRRGGHSGIRRCADPLSGRRRDPLVPDRRRGLHPRIRRRGKGADRFERVSEAARTRETISSAMPIPFRSLTPFAFVRDVAASIAFYRTLGFEVANTFAAEGTGEATWAWLKSDGAQLMIARATEPVLAEQQAVFFYLYVD